MTTTRSRSFLVPSTTPISTEQTLEHLHTLRHGDEWAVNMIAEHRALTTDQLIALGYDHDAATADKRLKRLVRLGWLHRYGPGFTARGYLDTTLWSIGPFGMAITATHDGPVTAAQAYRDRARLVRDPHLPHLMNVNQFFVELALYARTHPPTTDLRTWWSPFTCHRITASPRHKMWHGEYLHDNRRVRFWLEPDDGTTRPATLAAHIHRYRPIVARTEVPAVLFHCTDEERETAVRQHLSRLNTTGLYVATAHRYLGHPATQVWRPLNSEHRIALHEIPETYLAYNPADPFLHDPQYHAPHPIHDPCRPGDEAVADNGHTYTPPR